MSVSVRRVGVLAAVFWVALQCAAVGQTAVDEELPRTFAQGLASGVGGSFFEYYNFAAIVGIGILAGIAARGIIPLLAFSAASVVGVAIQISPFDLPFDEIMVALTTIAIGALVVRRQSIHPQVASVFFAIAGLYHGYSLSESIVGATTAPLLAYVGGMLLVQIGVGTIACAVAIKLSGQPTHIRGLTIAGILVTVAGAIAAIQAMGFLG
jgi:urease accessory protein